MKCPNCQTESTGGEFWCRSCSAPLAFLDEPEPRPLDIAIDLDRRQGRLPAREGTSPRDDLPIDEGEPKCGPEPMLDAPVISDPAISIEEGAFAEGARDDEPGGELTAYDPALESALEKALDPPRSPPGAEQDAVDPGKVRDLLFGQDPCEEPSIDIRSAAPLAVEAPDLPGERSSSAQDEILLTCAPIERRVAAWGMDSAILLTATCLPLLLAAQMFSQGSDVLQALVAPGIALLGLLSFVYGALAHTLMGATFGQRALGLCVVGPDGDAPGLGRSAVRALVALAGTAALGLGLAPALLTRSGRALHDVIARTVVVRAP